MYGNYSASDVTRTNRPSDAELCMRNCGCYRGSQGNQGYPGGSGFNVGVTVSGQVIGTNNYPATLYPMNATVNGRSANTQTDTVGRYAVQGMRGSDISVGPRLLSGLTSTPPNRHFINLQSDRLNSDFVLRGTAVR